MEYCPIFFMRQEFYISYTSHISYTNLPQHKMQLILKISANQSDDIYKRNNISQIPKIKGWFNIQINQCNSSY